MVIRSGVLPCSRSCTRVSSSRSPRSVCSASSGLAVSDRLAASARSSESRSVKKARKAGSSLGGWGLVMAHLSRAQGRSVCADHHRGTVGDSHDRELPRRGRQHCQGGQRREQGIRACGTESGAPVDLWPYRRLERVILLLACQLLSRPDVYRRCALGRVATTTMVTRYRSAFPRTAGASAGAVRVRDEATCGSGCSPRGSRE